MNSNEIRNVCDVAGKQSEDILQKVKSLNKQIYHLKAVLDGLLDECANGEALYGKDYNYIASALEDISSALFEASRSSETLNTDIENLIWDADQILSLDNDNTYRESYRRKRTRNMREWYDNQGVYQSPMEMTKSEVLSEADRLDAVEIKSTDSTTAYRLKREGYSCYCYSMDRYGNVSAMIAEKNGDFVFTRKPGSASTILGQG